MRRTFVFTAEIRHEIYPIIGAVARHRLARDTELLNLLAECYLQLNKNEQAEEVYRRINKIEPYNEGVKQKISVLSSQ